MKKTALLKLTSFILVLVLSVSIGMPLAAAADISAESPIQTVPIQDAATQGATSQDIHIETAVGTVTTEEPAPYDPNALVNAFKAEILRLVNVEREKAGVAPLQEMDALATPANTRAQESAVSFSHMRPDGTRCFTIFSENALRYRAAGENLAFGFTTPEDFVRAWMNSPAHRANLLDPDFTWIGIGYFESGINGKIYCSQLFYTPKFAY